MTMLEPISPPPPIRSKLFDWPDFGMDDDIRSALAEAMKAGEAVALATLHAARGGAPFGEGAQMLFTQTTVSGFLSGGCVEGDVAIHAADVLADGVPRHLIYGEGGPFDIQLPCGSRIEILVERIAADDPAAKRLIAQSATRRPLVWVTDGTRRACVEPGNLANLPSPLGPISPSDSASELRIYRTYEPVRRLVVVGADPIALSLLRLASEMGFETILVRPLGPDGPPSYVSQYYQSDIRTAFEALTPDPWTAIAVVIHDDAAENEALVASLATSASYVGALGSRRRIPERNVRLIAAGVGQDRIDTLHAPIGLPTGAKSPWEIAVSVMAEIVATSRFAA